MTEANTAAISAATAQVEALATELSERGFATTVVSSGKYRRLTVVNKAASQLSENVYAAPASDGPWWFWWSWGERIAPVEDVSAAAHAVGRVLRALDAAR